MLITRGFVVSLFLLLVFSAVSITYSFFATRPKAVPKTPHITITSNNIVYSDANITNQIIDTLPTPDPQKPYFTCQYKDTSISPTQKYIFIARSCYDQDGSSIIRTTDALNISNAYNLIFEKSDLLWSPKDEWFAVRAVHKDPKGNLTTGIFISHPDFPELLSDIFSLTPAEQLESFVLSSPTNSSVGAEDQISFTVKSCDLKQRPCIKVVTTTYNYHITSKNLVKTKTEISR